MKSAGYEECYEKVKAARTATPVDTEALNELRDFYGYELYMECLRAVLNERRD